uniref:LRRCT domain-containing protein n=1 Tax=Branchiostoma floridae TaxID=7739 RepID=C3XXR9_BRAFL|eukprot:XP_002611519.1 hypothetical protein BRAFLDRAFT_63844 [Branchiostoma floridae]
MFIRTEPNLFREMLRLRVGLIIQVMVSELARTLNCTGEEASEHLMSLSPFDLKTLLHHILSGKEFGVGEVERGGGKSLSIRKMEKEEVTGMSRLRKQVTIIEHNDKLRKGHEEDLEQSMQVDRQGQWLRRRRLDGALNRVPVDFYTRIWNVLKWCQGLSIEGQVLASSVINEMTPGELNFALRVEGILNSIPQPEYRQLMVKAMMMTPGELNFALRVEGILNSIPQPEYRQLMVEAMMVLALVVDTDYKRSLRGIIMVDKLVSDANAMFIGELLLHVTFRCQSKEINRCGLRGFSNMKKQITYNKMGVKLKRLLVLFLIVLKEAKPTAACSSSCSSHCSCSNRNLSSVPQYLPRNITKLYLRGNVITTTSPYEFLRYRSLIHLDLSSNRITYIQSATFSNLIQLQSLSLYNNKIANIQADVFSGLSQLQWLHLQKNQINSIEPGVFSGLLQLQKLFLHDNQLTNIVPDTFSNLPQLQRLQLYNNKIANIHADAFSSMPQLRSLQLQHNKITNIYPGTFLNLPQLQHLLLYHNQLTNILSGTFSNLPQLQRLSLSNNKITDIRPGSFSNLPQLVMLNLRDNQIATLPSQLYAELSPISLLNIQNNPWQCDCRVAAFRLRMSGSHSFERQITCSQPVNLQGQKLSDINPEDLICIEPTILSFHRGDDNTFVQETTIQLACQASGIPSPDITVTLPSGLTVSVESEGRVTVDVSGTITITNVTAADAGPTHLDPDTIPKDDVTWTHPQKDWQLVTCTDTSIEKTAQFT